MVVEIVPCQKCNGTGLIERTAGRWELPSGTVIEATPEKPIYQQCRDCMRKPAAPKRRFD